tara:strand:+ start:788 stop:949 length:162 start_codon:yes stop_codon:yes gene_type:complete
MNEEKEYEVIIKGNIGVMATSKEGAIRWVKDNLHLIYLEFDLHEIKLEVKGQE